MEPVALHACPASVRKNRIDRRQGADILQAHAGAAIRSPADHVTRRTPLPPLCARRQGHRLHPRARPRTTHARRDRGGGAPSPQHLQRVFAEWAGISPKRFLQFLTKEYARHQLAAADTLTVAEDAGLSSTSRLHDLMVSCEAMTPGEIRTAGRGIDIGHGVAPTPFGDALIAWDTARRMPSRLRYGRRPSPARRTAGALACGHARA
ncbi:helix-turn-helix domain-containing protein [Thauera humireducens]|uniref:helix-turn-helix domain-containing protein n=1 Tax=Thauera humireducens TaxID=1134435 RepID=UPI00311F1FF2